MPREPETDALSIHRLAPGDDALFDDMLDLFATAFEDPENYSNARPSASYKRALLARNDVIALIAITNQTVTGALVAYELMKFEQERSEFYIYDLAVSHAYRHRGIATALIETLKEFARENNGSVVYVQADKGDAPAIALYTKLGAREDVMHFDISLED